MSNIDSKNHNSNDGSYVQNVKNYWQDIKISNVSKLKTPEDYTWCNSVYQLEIPNNKRTDDVPSRNLAIKEMLFKSVNLKRIPKDTDKLCWQPSYISRHQYDDVTVNGIPK